MIKLSYGSQRQISFPSYKDYYFALGFWLIAETQNLDGKTTKTKVLGAARDEYIACSRKQIPQFFRFTAGRGAVYAE
jgi:hypothetical protein